MKTLLTIVLFFSSFFAQASNLVSLKDANSEESIVLIGGIGNNYEYFNPWIAELLKSSKNIEGFNHDHKSMSMTNAAQILAKELIRLNVEKSVKTVHLLSHSMGGLVAKKALHILNESNDIQKFDKIELTTYGTPFGGWFAANFARWIPGSSVVTDLLGLPMAQEMGSFSPFMKSLQVALPENVRFVMHESIADRVAFPKGETSIMQYMDVAKNAAEVVRYESIGHDDFVSVLTAAL